MLRRNFVSLKAEAPRHLMDMNLMAILGFDASDVESRRLLAQSLFLWNLHIFLIQIEDGRQN